MTVKVKKLRDSAQIPTYGSKGAACFDLYAAFENDTDVAHLQPGAAPVKIPTGLAFEVPEGYELQVRSRSGLASKGVRVANAPGCVDSDYRGEVFVLLSLDYVCSHPPIKQGDRIAQGCIVLVGKTTFEEVDELSDTERGAGGFGSTGV